MRKTICTATIFAAMIGILVALFAIEAPNWIWWMNEPILYGPPSLPLIAWLVGNLAIPAIMLVAALWFTYCLWDAAASICAKLRGEE